jgi:hypothetical protein
MRQANNMPFEGILRSKSTSEWMAVTATPAIIATAFKRSGLGSSLVASHVLTNHTAKNRRKKPVPRAPASKNTLMYSLWAWWI